MKLAPAANPTWLAAGTDAAREALAMGFSGYRLMLMGRYTKGGQQLERARKVSQGAAQPEALLSLIEGLGLRCRGAFAPAAEALERAATGLAAGTIEQGLARVLVADAWCQAGKIGQARAWLESGYGAAPGPAADIAAGLIRSALGQFDDAERLLAAAVPQAPSPVKEWGQLARAQNALDRGAVALAEECVGPLRAALDAEVSFDERYVRTLWLDAQVKLVRHAGREAGRPERQAVLDALGDAAGYGTNMTLYSLSTQALRATLDVVDLDAEPDAAARAAEALVGAGCWLEASRCLTRLALVLAAREKDRSTPVIARARDLWHQIGAPDRARPLTPSGAGAPADLSLARSVAGSVMMSGSIANVMLDSDIELQSVFDLVREVSSTRSVQTLLERVVQLAVKVVKAERGALVQRMPDGQLVCVAAQGLSPAEVVDGNQQVSFGVLRACLDSEAPVLTDNALTDERFKERASVQASDLKSIACVPLKTPRALLGLLYVDSSARSRLFTEASRDLLAVFGAQAAQALENAQAFEEIESLNKNLEGRVVERTAQLSEANRELKASIDELTNTRLKLSEAQRDALEKEMKLARDVQMSIVPAPGLHRVGPLQVAGVLEPASFCGGDFWTWGELGPGRAFVFVGDVTGHGMAAALLTAVARSCLDTLLPLGVTTPAAMLARLSDAVYGSSKGQRAMTAWLGVFDLGRGELTYANAGHCFPMFVDRSSGLAKLKSLPATGSRLGEAPGLTFDEQVSPFRAGDDLLLYTDGLTECTAPDGTAFGERKLRRLVAELATQRAPPDQLVAKVMDSAHAHYAQAPREDDVTVLALGMG